MPDATLATRTLLAKIAAIIAIEAVSIALITAGIGAEFVTGFEVTTVPHDNGSAMVVANAGILQASNVIFDGMFPGAVGMEGDAGCMEGAGRVSDTGHVRATFERMTPNHPCMVAMVPDGTSTSSVRITADGYLATWTPARAEHWDHLLERLGAGEAVLWIVFICQLVIAMIILADLVMFVVHVVVLAIRRIAWKTMEHSRPKLLFESKIADHLKSEYGLHAGRDEAAVVLVVFCGKDTMGQIIKYTKMAKGRATHVLNLLREAGIVVGDAPTIVPSLRMSLEAHHNDLCKCVEDATIILNANAESPQADSVADDSGLDTKHDGGR